ncbi:putative DNA-binding transcriptional regulator [Limnobaculum zhutongyuii]|uniref:Putative DNA-binding transcriptional regulator n=1 Tax=Limnobaculum zhutongyuii TaxID=2498113 RepID=A0A411WH00_9GAMM|nr:DNA-binding protein [Limnobaculum zhutongyuii]QBH95257.1 putative DNA-binding transcriptional regulator [Limnobaculum zhutongyuii]TQS89125.1 putative DNA-binding transcriptional regulator [Limnobaculum zhutongyuii]
MKKEWFSTRELTGVAGLPGTIQGINQKAHREKWESRKRTGVQGKALEYHINSIPEKVQIALQARENGVQFDAIGNDSLSIWISAFHQLTEAEREKIISLIMRQGIAGLMAKVNWDDGSDDASQS